MDHLLAVSLPLPRHQSLTRDVLTLGKSPLCRLSLSSLIPFQKNGVLGIDENIVRMYNKHHVEIHIMPFRLWPERKETQAI